VSAEKPTRKSAPKTAAPKTAAPKTAAPKTAAPKTAAPKTAAPRAPRGKAAVAAPAATAPGQAVTQAPPAAAVSGLRQRYLDDVAPALRREFGYANPMQTPRLHKVIVNIGLGEAIQNAKALDAAVGDLTRITGQKPIVTKAKRSIAQFRLRTGMPIGAKVTLRGQRMYDFLERTMRLALPRIRDFRGISRNSFDGRGNFTLGLREQLVYPEIDYDKIDRLRGMEISIVTTAKTDEEGLKLLQLLGMPFQAS